MNQQRDIDHALTEIDENIHLFERTLKKRTDLPEVSASRVLALSDGSNQDESVLRLAELVADRLGAELVRRELGPGGGEAPLTDDRDRLPFEVLEQIDEQSIGLVVLPTPFLEDYPSLGATSLGVVADVLLARSPVPMIHVRQPLEDPRAVLESGVLVCLEADPETRRAAAWLWRLVPGPLQVLVALASAEHHAILKFSRGEEQPVTLEDIGQKLGEQISPLLATMQERARQEGRRVEGHAYPDELREVLVQESFPLCLVVVPGREDPDHTGPLARECVRYTRGPVLVVP
ncbi:MAG: universal stress protein [Planctomycetota bacterium]